MEPAVSSTLLSAADQARLRLTAEQREQVSPILLDEAEQLSEVRADLLATPSRRDRFFLICEARWIREEADNRIEALLQENQQDTWDDIRDHRRAALRDEFQRHATFPPFPHGTADSSSPLP
jgi:hypothetical protein